MPSMPSTTNVGSAAKISGPDIINCNYNLYSQGQRQAGPDNGQTRRARTREGQRILDPHASSSILLWPPIWRNMNYPCF